MRFWLLAWLLVIPGLARTAEPFLSRPLNLRAVVPGKVYRSADLCILTAEQSMTLRDLGLRTVIDLRSPLEVLRFGQDRPVLVPDGRALQVALPPLAGREGYEEYMRLRKDFSPIFRLLAQESTYPVLFHCHRGKDRTGVVAALLQELLGASREEIYADYLRSTEVGPGGENHVQADWLDAVFEAVDKSGGIEAFLEASGVTADEQASIRRILAAGK